MNKLAKHQNKQKTNNYNKRRDLLKQEIAVLGTDVIEFKINPCKTEANTRRCISIERRFRELELR